MGVRYPPVGERYSGATEGAGHRDLYRVTVPESVTELCLFVDADAGGALAERRARDAYGRDDRAILTHRPNQEGADWNDVLQAGELAPS